MTRTSISRIRLFSVLIVLFALILVGQLYLVQIVRGGEYESKADRQYLQSTYDYYNRGSIYFETKDGETVSAASLKSGFIVSMNPKLIGNKEELYKTLSGIIPLVKEEFMAKAERVDDPYEVVARKIPNDLAYKITKLNLPGVTLFKERWRFYPGNSLAAHALGFLAYKDDELAGRYGLERYYEEVLGRNNESVFVNFFAEIFSNIKEGLSDDGKLEGDIVTSLEPSVEAFLEDELKKIDKTLQSDFSGGIIMDPKTGEIIAMALTPTYDPNNLQDENVSIFSNKLVESVYEMGSIIKPLTMAAGIDAGAVTADTLYFDSGTVTLDKKTFSNFDGKARGTVSMQEVLSQSLNTGAAFVVKKMGKENFARYMLAYGINEETGIDLPNETHGLTDNLESPRDIEYATASFGQGIALTPIETIRALASLGNGGILVNPHIANRINYRIGGHKNISPGVDKQILKKETSEEITRMLVHVVDHALLGGEVKLPNYSVAAKTGTAQIAKPVSGGYYDDRYLHSFFGYFPAYNPRFIVFLFTHDPKGVKYASETLTHPFIDITKFLINYYQIPPDR